MEIAIGCKTSFPNLYLIILEIRQGKLQLLRQLYFFNLFIIFPYKNKNFYVNQNFKSMLKINL